MKEIKITIPDNCELVKEGDVYIIKKKNPPRSWEEFCANYPVLVGECYIKHDSSIVHNNYSGKRNLTLSKNYCVSKEEAEAFLALMQLRQLRKAWIGDWDKKSHLGDYKFNIVWSEIYSFNIYHSIYSRALSFPSKEMAKDFLSCFRNLCETAKILL